MNGVKQLLLVAAMVLFVLAGLAIFGVFALDEAMGLVAFGLAAWCAAGLVR